MKYIALLRGINVGGNNKVEMKKLKALFESLGYDNVSTYINSGNVIFELKDKAKDILEKIRVGFRKEFGFDALILIKTEKEMKRISAAIPREWKNDTKARTDVAYLFPEIDAEKIINELPVKKEFMDIRYVQGAIFWNVERENVYKSHLGKLIGHKLYKLMTIRNINTARYLAGE
jgi:uncharacterized protein (DUF1697 family)